VDLHFIAFVEHAGGSAANALPGVTSAASLEERTAAILHW
jgi:hypothetical protein